MPSAPPFADSAGLLIFLQNIKVRQVSTAQSPARRPLGVMHRLCLLLPLIILSSCNGYVDYHWSDCNYDSEFNAAKLKLDSLGIEIKYPSDWQLDKVDGLQRLYYGSSTQLTHITFAVGSGFSDLWNTDPDGLEERGIVEINEKKYRYMMTREGRIRFLSLEIKEDEITLLQVLPVEAENQGFCESKLIIENLTVHDS